MVVKTQIPQQFKSMKSTSIGGRRPICVDCKTEMIPEKNSILVCQHNPAGKPIKIWCADLWKCPMCEYEIILGFGSGAISEWYEDSFEGWFKDVEYHF